MVGRSRAASTRERVRFQEDNNSKKVVNHNPLLGYSEARKKGISERRRESGIFQSRRRDGMKNGERKIEET